MKRQRLQSSMTCKSKFSYGLSRVGRIAFVGLAWLVILPISGVWAAEWQVMALNGEASVGPATFQVAFDGSFSGTTGCNSFQGKAVFEDGAIVVEGPVAMTKMACPGNRLAAQEDGFGDLLGGRMSVAFNPISDVLTLSNGETTVELVRRTGWGAGLPELPETHAGVGPPAGSPPYLNPFGLSEDLPINAQPDTSSDVVGGAFSGQVLRNLGCESDWCRVEPLDGSFSGWSQRTYLERSDSILRAAQRVFDAVGPVPCAVGEGTPMGTCGMGVARDQGGTATVVVAKPDGVSRILFFTDGAFIGSDTSQAGGGFESSAVRERDLTLIRVDNERYEIVDAVIFGG
ncbi:META domain-containing protein [Marimonas sp. MJW-29]|uniref:META domain-containing protein n=1 Tax=Sulfitobacter sediminis TaxID=3234186 RepID=A0ABV3RTG5_9RHOB